MLKRSIMTLYSGATDAYSHQVRMVLAEKGVTVDILQVDANHPCEDLLELTPYNSLPTLVDRELVLYQSFIILEYLDERFPHPPLLPVYPIARAKSRLMIYRIEKDWYSQIKLIENKPDTKQAETARKELRDGLTALEPVFGEMKYFLSEEFSLVDCCFGPLLWRLPSLGIKLNPKQAKAILEYGDRVFSRPCFQASLTEAERELRTV